MLFTRLWSAGEEGRSDRGNKGERMRKRWYARFPAIPCARVRTVASTSAPASRHLGCGSPPTATATKVHESANLFIGDLAEVVVTRVNLLKGLVFH